MRPHRGPRGLVGADMRVANEQLVAAKLLAAGSMSVGALATGTGLSVPTVHRALGHLADLGVLRCIEATASQKRGRPAAAFRLSLRGARVAVADVGNETARFGVVDEMGIMRDEQRIPTEELRRDLLGSLASRLREPISRMSPRGFLVGAVVGLPAAVDPGRGEIVGAPVYRGWVGLEVRARLREALGCPVELFQDDHLAAWGERADWQEVGAGTVVAVSIGKGIGIGWADERGPVQGDHGRAGRVADWPELGLHAGDVVLANVLTADALAAAYRERGGRGGPAETNLSGLALAELARGGDRVAKEVFDKASRALGFLLLRVGILLDPSLMVIRGGLAGARDLLDAGVARTVGLAAGEDDDSRLRWTWTRLGDRSVLAGATRVGGTLFQSWLDTTIMSALVAPQNAESVDAFE